MSLQESYEMELRTQFKTAICSVEPTLTEFIVADFDDDKRELIVSFISFC